MSNKHFCQGPHCHERTTQDRFLKSRGVIRGRYALFNMDADSYCERGKYFCSTNCESLWLDEHMKNIEHIAGLAQCQRFRAHTMAKSQAAKPKRCASTQLAAGMLVRTMQHICNLNGNLVCLWLFHIRGHHLVRDRLLRMFQTASSSFWMKLALRLRHQVERSSVRVSARKTTPMMTLLICNFNNAETSPTVS